MNASPIAFLANFERLQRERLISADINVISLDAIWPVVSRKNSAFSAHFGPGGAVLPPRVLPLKKVKRSNITHGVVMKKIFICLAKSAREGGFCIAGKEILISESVFGNFSFYSYKKACGQKKTVRGSKNSRRLSNGTPAI